MSNIYIEKNKLNISNSNSNTEFVLLYNDWCGFCQRILPHWATLEKEFAGKHKLTKYEGTKDAEKFKKYSIRGVPTIFKEVNGEIKDQLVRYRDLSPLKDFLNK